MQVDDREKCAKMKLLEHERVQVIMSVDWAVLREQITNRDIATVVWLLLFLWWGSRRPGVRKTLGSLRQTLLNRAIIVVVFLALLYVSAIICILRHFGLWSIASLKDTVVWVFTGAIYMIFSSVSASTKEDHFQRTIVGALKIAVITEAVVSFLLSLYPLDLWKELLLVPVMALLGMMLALCESDPKFAVLVKPIRWLLTIIGLFLIWHTLHNLVHDWNVQTATELLIDFSLQTTLTILFFPFIYLLTVYFAYERVFIRLDIQNSDRQLIALAKRKIFVTFGLNLHALVRWSRRQFLLKIHSMEDLTRLLETDR